MENRWRLTDGPRPFALTEALDKLEVPAGSPLTFRHLLEPKTGRTCCELIALDRLPVGVDLSSGETFSQMLDHVGVPAPDEQVGDPDEELLLIRITRDGERPVPVAVVAYDE
jgi:hypothetical protein